ncbi:MAG: hypothetical protein EPN47_14160 [Acidobacteria bacterium]|nr:MAG: hypothetical protein EPN47_14160 [Acidobacteriota bacterium]
MAKKQTIIWTALPNGISNGQLQLSVFVSPRLQTDEGLPRPALSQFDDFKNWPNKIKDMKFTVQFEGQSPVQATRVGPAAEPDVWNALFKSTTYVEPYQFNDYSARPVISHPVLNLGSFVKSQYQSVAAASPTRLPSRAVVLERLAPISLYALPEAASPASRTGMASSQRFAGALRTQQPQSLRTAQSTQRAVRPVVIPEDLTSFVRTLHPTLQQNANRNIQMLVREPYALKPATVSAFQSVYQDLQQYKAVRPSPQLQPERDFLLLRISKPALPEAAQPIQLPEIDFHKIVSSLGNYPEIMKALGLVINLAVPLPGSLATNSTVRVAPTWSSDSQPASFNTDFSPKTAYAADTSRSWFAPRPETPDSDIIDGQLKLNDHQSFPVMSVDVDGSALKMANLADRLASAALAESEMPAPVERHPMMERMGPSGNGSGKTRASSGPSGEVLPGNQALRSQSTAALPALRTGGLSVSKTGKAEWLAGIFARATLNNQAVDKNTPDQVTLYAEDVVRGYRVDVWDSETTAWNSLCRRVGTYNFFEANILRQYQDEGFVQLATTQSSVQPSSGSSTPQDMYLHESMFDWNGWSLCAPRPGKVISPDSTPQSLDDPAVAQQRAQSEFKMVATFVPQPGSLPKLRFGRTYRVRARVVDLAGNSLTHDAPNPTDFSKVTDPHTYNRFEPVVGPVAVLTKSLDGSKSPGEALYRPVIRSNFDKTAQEYAQAYAQRISDSSYTASTFRIVAPPKTSELMAEKHGTLDLSSGAMKKDPATYQMVAKMADGAFALDPMTKNPVADKLEMPYLPDPLCRGMSMVLLDHDGNSVGTVPPVEFYPQGTGWPQAQPFFIKVVEGQGKIDWNWDDSSRTLTVQLPKAEVAKFELSSYLGGGQMGVQNQAVLGVWSWIQEAGPSNLTMIRSAAGQGRLWMLTPARELVMVHAVQQPLIAPAFHQLLPNRHLGETFSYIVDDRAMPVDGKSTLKVDVLANWQEPIDDANDPSGPRTQTGNAHVYTRDLTPEDTAISDTLEMTAAAANHETMGPQPLKSSTQRIETRPLTVQQQVQSHQAPAQAEQMARPGQEFTARPEFKLQPGIQIPNDVRLYRPPKYPIGLENFGYSWRHDFGDTRYRKVSYQAVATTRFREYFPIANSDELTRKSPPVAVDVPNSARPARPNVLYVVPAFGWDRKENVRFDGNTRPDIAGTPISGISGFGSTSKRMPGGLRIYMDRPWYSSGDGELLGVVIWPGELQAPLKSPGIVIHQGDRPNVSSMAGNLQPQQRSNRSVLARTAQISSGLPESLRPVVTQWGIDPIWEANPLPAERPSFEHFKNTAQVGVHLTLPELQGLQDPSATYYDVGVAAYKPEYDKDRRLWYCDLEIDAGNAYFPFIRLALVRYQPNSLANAHLSGVVLADLAQLTPERTAAITYDPNNPNDVDIVIAGLSYSSTSAGKGPSLVEATLETNPTSTDDETAWIPVPDGTMVLQAKPLGIYSVWRYRLRLHRLKVPKNQALRLVIKEYDILQADAINQQGRAVLAARGPVTGQRLVYAEVLKVPPIH